MALTNFEKRIKRVGLKSGKTRDEISQSIINYRRGIKKPAEEEKATGGFTFGEAAQDIKQIAEAQAEANSGFVDTVSETGQLLGKTIRGDTNILDKTGAGVEALTKVGLNTGLLGIESIYNTAIGAGKLLLPQGAEDSIESGVKTVAETGGKIAKGAFELLPESAQEFSIESAEGIVNTLKSLKENDPRAYQRLTIGANAAQLFLELFGGKVAKKGAEDITEEAIKQGNRAKETVSDITGDVINKASDIKDNIKTKTSDIKENIKTKASDIKEDIKGKASNAKDFVKDKVGSKFTKKTPEDIEKEKEAYYSTASQGYKDFVDKGVGKITQEDKDFIDSTKNVDILTSVVKTAKKVKGEFTKITDNISEKVIKSDDNVYVDLVKTDKKQALLTARDLYKQAIRPRLTGKLKALNSLKRDDAAIEKVSERLSEKYKLYEKSDTTIIDFAEALDTESKALWKKMEERLIESGEKSKISTKSMVKALESKLKNDENVQFDKKTRKELQDIILDFTDEKGKPKDISPLALQNVISSLNEELGSKFRGTITKSVSSAKILQLTTAKDLLNKTIDKLKGEKFSDIKSDYASFRTLKDDVISAAIKDNQASGLAGLTDIFSAGDLAAGVIEPAFFLKGITQALTKGIFAKMSDKNNLLRQSFLISNELSKRKETKPTKPKSKKPSKKPKKTSVKEEKEKVVKPKVKSKVNSSVKDTIKADFKEGVKSGTLVQRAKKYKTFEEFDKSEDILTLKSIQKRGLLRPSSRGEKRVLDLSGMKNTIDGVYARTEKPFDVEGDRNLIEFKIPSKDIESKVVVDDDYYDVIREMYEDDLSEGIKGLKIEDYVGQEAIDLGSFVYKGDIPPQLILSISDPTGKRIYFNKELSNNKEYPKTYYHNLFESHDKSLRKAFNEAHKIKKKVVKPKVAPKKKSVKIKKKTKE